MTILAGSLAIANTQAPLELIQITDPHLMASQPLY